MPGPQRPASGLATRRTAMRPTARRLGTAMTEKSHLPGDALKPMNANTRSIKSPNLPATAGTKRKERDFEPSPEDTSIHVVVRCRGRNDREIKENSGVVISTEGTRGNTVEVSMGPNAVSNKTYHFDKVFSAAADQTTIYEDVMLPILNEMLSGYNCTVFAYGQTGTGKTYTMSGDMTDTLGLLSDDAGIIPRVLYGLFHKLEETESTVKCSFIELYNEELRDLLSQEDNSKLKIFDNDAKKGHNGSTLVQGAEETFIHSASAGIKLLQAGSYKRQVAATKCNDLSSRSHTVFTIMTQVKRTTETGEEYVNYGKLNLVDLAGSENIQRSGADSKRAAEAGLINKSLLTLGRVINALVDKSSHIPYRESKLTRLLQDSLGGQTKTCIIATVSPARSNLEETISTLDYAFRAKNIRNKPQINPTLPKKTLLREYTIEIEKLKSELIATRHRNGVYLSAEAFDEMTVESDTRRIVNEEQRAKIESMEASLRNKLQELFALTSNFNNLKKDNDETRTALNETSDILEKTEIILRDTKRQLKQEETLRKAHQETEDQLHGISAELLSKLDQTVEHVNGLHSKIQRTADLHESNREVWMTSTTDVNDVTKLIDERVAAFASHHSSLTAKIAAKLDDFVSTELAGLQSSQMAVDTYTADLDEKETAFRTEASKSQDDMSEVLEEIKVLREEVKDKVAEGLNGLSAAAARISKEVLDELNEVHHRLRSSYTSLGHDLKNMFGDIMQHVGTQRAEIATLRKQLEESTRQAVEDSKYSSTRIQNLVKEDREIAETERLQLFSQIKSLIEEADQKRTSRLKNGMESVQIELTSSADALEISAASYSEKMDIWDEKETKLVEQVTASREAVDERIAGDWTAFDERNACIKRATESVHQETVRIVDVQMEGMASQMAALDDFVTKARAQNTLHHDARIQTFGDLATDVRGAYSSIQGEITGVRNRVEEFRAAMSRKTTELDGTVGPFVEEIREPMTELRNSVHDSPLDEYTPTGTTPPRTTYEYPKTLPRTEPHNSIIGKIKQARHPVLSQLEGEELAPLARSPSKTRVYNDTEDEVGTLQPAVTPCASSNTGLREVDANVVAKPLSYSTDFSASLCAKSSPEKDTTPNLEKDEMAPPPSKRHLSASVAADNKLPQNLTRRLAGIAEGRENVPISSGRRLRNRPSNG